MASDDNTAERQNAKMSEERAFLTKLLEAALEGKGSTVKSLVLEYSHKHGDMPVHEVLSQFKDGQGRTALHFACMSTATNKDEDVVACLLTSTNDWNITKSNLESMVRLKDREGLSLLMLACQNTNKQLAKERVEFLLNTAGHKIALARSGAGATALHYAAGAGALPETIKALDKAAHVALQTCSKRGGTPLHWASGSRGADYSDTIQALLDCGANINAPNEQGMAPVVMAVAAANDRHAKLLIQQGAAYNMELPGNITLFHMAADLNLVGTLAALVETCPAEELHKYIQQENAQGETPLDLAVQEGHTGCVMLLLPGGENDEESAKQYIANHKKDNTKDKQAPQEMPRKEDNTEENVIEARAKQYASKVLQECSTVSDDDKQVALELKAQGNDSFKNKNWEGAIELYGKAIESDPTNATFYSNRSACFMCLKEYNKALVDAVICQHLKPEWPKAYYRVAVARYELGRYEDAAVAAWEGLQKDTTNDELKSLLQKSVKHGKRAHEQSKKAGKNDEKRGVHEDLKATST